MGGRPWHTLCESRKLIYRPKGDTSPQGKDAPVAKRTSSSFPSTAAWQALT